MLFLKKNERAIFLFHRILPVRDEMWDPIDPALFKKSLQYIQKQFHVIPLKEMLFYPRPASGKPLAAITFDDGYHDFIDYAIPILDVYKLKASMYVISDSIDKNLPTWTYLLDHIFAKTTKLEWKGFNFFDLPAEYHHTRWSNNKERIEYCKKLKQFLKKIPALRRDEVIAGILTYFDDIAYPDGMMMSWEDIKQVHSAGFEIGSHSVSHPTLATLEDERQIEFELQESAKRIREKTGIEPDIFSYPIGSYDERVKRIARKTGYKAGLAVNGKPYDPEKQDIFEVPRIELYNENWIKNKNRLNGLISYFK
jgi:peptidoglycan/xylan/chitin deacetylase (PgdA/CDA1 family)